MESMSTMTAGDAQPRSMAATTVEARERVRLLETLAEALPSLVARDDECPPLWLLPSFASRVEAVRAQLAAVATTEELASRLRPNVMTAADPRPVRGGRPAARGRRTERRDRAALAGDQDRNAAPGLARDRPPPVADVAGIGATRRRHALVRLSAFRHVLRGTRAGCCRHWIALFTQRKPATNGTAGRWPR